jgi:hypothetical protein
MRRTKRIAFGGILTALTVIAVFAAAYVPSGKLSVYVLASFFTAVFVIHFGAKFGLLFYITASLLSWILLPDKMAVVPYAGFFGWYGIVKSYIEKLNKLLLEWILKIVIMNLVFAVGYFLVRSFLPQIDFSSPWIWGGFILLQIAFVVYDYVFTMVINVYYRRFYSKFGNE